MTRARRALAVVATLLLGGCAASTPAPVSPVASGQPLAPAVYTLGVGDKIALNVWRHQDLARNLTVDTSGNVALPLAGEVKAEGLTPAQLEEEVRLRLSKYLVNPRVDISVSAVMSQKYHVLGEVKAPGSFPLDQRTGVWDALARAGGGSPVIASGTEDNHSLKVSIAPSYLTHYAVRTPYYAIFYRRYAGT